METFISIQFGFTQHHNYQPLIGSSAADCPHNTSAFVSTLIIHDSNFSVPMCCDLRAILPWLPWRRIIASKCPMTQQRATCPASSFLPALACNIINQAPKPLYRDHLPEVNTYYFSGPFVLYWDQRVCLCHCVSGCLQARVSLCCSCQFVCLCVGTWKWMITLQKSYCTMPHWCDQMKSAGSVTDREKRRWSKDGGRQNYGAANRQKKENKLADDSLSWGELMFCCFHSPFTSPSTPVHLTCLQSNLNVCFITLTWKNYWRELLESFERSPKIARGEVKKGEEVEAEEGQRSAHAEKGDELVWWDGGRGWGESRQANRNGSCHNWLDILSTTALAAGAAIAMGHHDSAGRYPDITFRLSKCPGPSSLLRKHMQKYAYAMQEEWHTYL